MTLVALGIGREVRAEDECRVVKIEVHAAVVDERCLMKRDVDAVVGEHLECRLDTGGRERLP